MIFVWLVSLCSIPLFSFYGRELQHYVMGHYSTDTLVVGLGVLLAGVVFSYLVVLSRAGVSTDAFHLIWIAALALLFYVHLPFVEKIHIAIFGLFGFLSQKVLEQKLATLVCVLLPGLDELFQCFLASRVGDWRDVWLNLFSAALGMFLAYLLTTENNSDTRVKR